MDRLQGLSTGYSERSAVLAPPFLEHYSIPTGHYKNSVTKNYCLSLLSPSSNLLPLPFIPWLLDCKPKDKDCLIIDICFESVFVTYCFTKMQGKYFKINKRWPRKLQSTAAIIKQHPYRMGLCTCWLPQPNSYWGRIDCCCRHYCTVYMYRDQQASMFRACRYHH